MFEAATWNSKKYQGGWAGAARGLVFLAWRLGPRCYKVAAYMKYATFFV